MSNYREFQFGWILFVFVLFTQAIITFLFAGEIGTRPIGLQSFIVSNLLFATLVILFYGMRIKMDDAHLVVSFGVGLIRKKVDLRRVKSLEIVKSPWYYGWGIRLIPGGWLYNISGCDAVELKLNDTKRVIRIGTKNPKRLVEEISARMTQN